MELEFSTPAFRLLQLLRENAPNMKLCQAYDQAKEITEMRHDLGKYEYIIVTLIELLGIDNTGWLKDPVIGERLQSVPIEIWGVLQQATKVQAGYVCSPFTPEDWKQKAAEKYLYKRDQIESYRESQLSVCFPKSFGE